MAGPEGLKGRIADSVRARPRRAVTVTAAVFGGVLGTLVLSGCGVQTGLGSWSRLGYPPSASDRTPAIQNLWYGTWITAAVIGVLVWTLILWAVFRYRRRSDDEVPRQTRYNLPLEICYTAAPFLIIGVLFFYTINAQGRVLNEVQPAHTVDVVGWKWSWTFNYEEQNNSAVDEVVYDTGTPEHFPTLYLEVNQPVKFNLTSPDVIHSFWVPAFYFKMDVIPGRENSFTITPDKEGTFAGKCAELCGTGHSQMLFTVKVVSADEFNQHLQQLKAAGQTGEAGGGQENTIIKGSPGDPENQGKEGES